MTNPKSTVPRSRSDGPKKRRTSVRTAAHVCAVFECFIGETNSLTLTHVANKIGLKKSSVYRLLQTLVSCDFLTFDNAVKRYQLGPRVDKLVGSYHGQSSLIAIAKPFMERLRNLTRESIALQIRDENARYIVSEVASPEAIRMLLGENMAYPLTSGAAGHILRAFSMDWNKETDRKVLRQMRRDRYAISRDEVIKGATAICVPILNANGLLIAALSVHGPTDRISNEATGKIVSSLKSSASELGILVANFPGR
jgi:DNA-binding IclR family transcriptional regulator